MLQRRNGDSVYSRFDHQNGYRTTVGVILAHGSNGQRQVLLVMPKPDDSRTIFMPPQSGIANGQSLGTAARLLVQKRLGIGDVCIPEESKDQKVYLGWYTNRFSPARQKRTRRRGNIVHLSRREPELRL